MMDLELALWRASTRLETPSEWIEAVKEVVSQTIEGVQCVALWRLDAAQQRWTRALLAGQVLMSGAADAAPDTFAAREPAWERAFRGSAGTCLRAWTGVDGARHWLISLGAETSPSVMVSIALDAESTADDELTAQSATIARAVRAALHQHDRIVELQRLKEAAEAERNALLQRLNRGSNADEIVGADGGLRTVLRRVEQVARSTTPVLLLGETGSGKEVIARHLHRESARTAGPMVRVNCGAIPSELIDSELFGHEKGAFTGATATRLGWFERADGGTLLLDEVGELPLAAQVRLLRVLQDGVITRVGAQSDRQVDVRVVAATHRDLESMVHDGSFRQDLWYRLSVFPIRIPPLRERVSDIEDLARFFMARAAARIGFPLLDLTPENLAVLQSYRWPGNARELSAVIERAVILGEGRFVDVRGALGMAAPGVAGAPVSAPGEGTTAAVAEVDGSHRDAGERATNPGSRAGLTLDEAIADHIALVLSATGGVIEGPDGAAARLGENASTLRSRMKRLGMDPRRFRR